MKDQFTTLLKRAKTNAAHNQQRPRVNRWKPFHPRGQCKPKVSPAPPPLEDLSPPTSDFEATPPPSPPPPMLAPPTAPPSSGPTSPPRPPRQATPHPDSPRPKMSLSRRESEATSAMLDIHKNIFKHLQQMYPRPAALTKEYPPRPLTHRLKQGTSCPIMHPMVMTMCPLQPFVRAVCLDLNLACLRSVHDKPHLIAPTSAPKASQWNVPMHLVDALPDGRLRLAKAILSFEKSYAEAKPLDPTDSPATLINRIHDQLRLIWTALSEWQEPMNRMSILSAPVFIIRHGPFLALDIAWIKRTPQTMHAQALIAVVSNRHLNPRERFVVPFKDIPPTMDLAQRRLVPGPEIKLQAH